MFNDRVKFQKIIPVGKQTYAYQCEDISLVLKLTGSIPHRSGSEPYANEEKDKLRDWHQYELEIYRHTSNAMTVQLRKFYKDGKIELYQTTMSFADLANQIFKDWECSLYDETELGHVGP
jgi:hypothetical protein